MAPEPHGLRTPFLDYTNAISKFTVINLEDDFIQINLKCI